MEQNALNWISEHVDCFPSKGYATFWASTLYRADLNKMTLRELYQAAIVTQVHHKGSQTYIKGPLNFREVGVKRLEALKKALSTITAPPQVIGTVATRIGTLWYTPTNNPWTSLAVKPGSARVVLPRPSYTLPERTPPGASDETSSWAIDDMEAK